MSITQRTILRKAYKLYKTMPVRENKISYENVSTVIMKKTDSGKRLKEHDLFADDVFAANTERIFHVKGKCKASLKRQIRSIEVCINKASCGFI